MSTTRIAVPVIKRLFALSGNICCYPGCHFKVVDDNDKVLAHIAHIRSDRPGGPRYDEHQTEPERQGFKNLMLLCPTHHARVDNDIAKFPVERLQEIKAKHEERQRGVLFDDEIERGAALLSAAATVSSVGQSGGITAHTVNQTYVFAPSEAGVDKLASKATLSALALPFHEERIKMVMAGQPVATIDAPAILLQVFPASALLNQDSPAAREIYRAAMSFKPLHSYRPADFKIGSDGLLTGSNDKGLGYPQRAYTHVSETGVISAVNSDLTCGREHNFVQLRGLHHSIVEGSQSYVSALTACGFKFPMVIMASLVGVRGLRLVNHFDHRAFLEDCPSAQVDKDVVNLGSEFIEAPIATMQAAADALRSMLDRLSNSAGLPTSPHYDDSGVFSL